jgi:formate dehydrogenase
MAQTQRHTCDLKKCTLECFFEGRPIRNEYLIVQGGKLAGAGAHSYTEGDATKGSEEAARFKH